MRLLRVLTAGCVIGAHAAPVAAQVARITVESAASIDLFGGENVSNRPQIVLDVAATVRVDDHWQLFVRPWFRKARPSRPSAPVPAWESEIYQAGVRYERPGDVALRLDAGTLVSPIGLGLLDARPDLNPTIVPHLSYVIPMPTFETTVPLQFPVAATYPLGGQLTVSTATWDARAAIVNSAPSREYAIGNDANPRQTPVFAAGAGVTPHIGLRFGASVARGNYATAKERTLVPAGALAMTLAGAEAEYAFGYTKLAGEIIRTAFETPANTAVAYEWFVQGKQTLTPRWFVAARHEGTSAPPLLTRVAADAPASLFARRATLRIVEATAAFRASPNVTIRGSFFTRRSYNAPAWNRQFGVSAVWFARFSR